MPNWLTARARIDVNAFRLTRAQTSIVVDSASSAVTQSTSEHLSSQIALSICVYLDATIIALFGFVPNINGSIDFLRLRNGATVDQKMLLVISAGVRREVF